MHMRDESLDFYCSKFMLKTKVYQLCDDWKSREEGYSTVYASHLNEDEARETAQEKIANENDPLILIPTKQKKNLYVDPLG